MGSGSTGSAALKAGRPFVGVEIEQEYFDVACRRLEAEARQFSLAI
jgi:DNA modification methylase